MIKCKIINGYQFISIVLGLSLCSGCFVSKEKYHLKEMELSQTEKKYVNQKEKTEEIQRKLADKIKGQEALKIKNDEYKTHITDIKVKYDKSLKEKRELSSQNNELQSHVLDIEKRLNEQRTKITILKIERNNFANIVKTIKELVSDFQIKEEKKAELVLQAPPVQQLPVKTEENKKSITPESSRTNNAKIKLIPQTPPQTKQLPVNTEVEKESATTEISPATDAISDKIQEKLEILKGAFDVSTLTEDEYHKKRGELLSYNSLLGS